jgi:hypothetical protein
MKVPHDNSLEVDIRKTSNLVRVGDVLTGLLCTAVQVYPALVASWRRRSGTAEGYQY